MDREISVKFGGTCFVWLILASVHPIHAAEPAVRVPWTSSRVFGTPEPPSPYRVESIDPGLRFETPIDFAVEPGTGRWFVLQLNGEIRAVHPRDLDSVTAVLDPVDSSMSVHQAFAIAFHPRYIENRQLFVCYIDSTDGAEGTRVVRFRVKEGDTPHIDPEQEELLLTWPAGGHNGGCLRFGPDGMLYISTGDGANPFPPDEFNAGQSLNDLRAAILRIDVDQEADGKPYAIPADNPFVSEVAERKEIYALGLRNPWRMSFDPESGDLWAGDVGWELWESLFRIVPGGNYRWPLFEGQQPVRTDVTVGPGQLQTPILEHSHSEGRSITGGVVYRGNALPELHGSYIYGDWATGKIWSFTFDSLSRKVLHHRELVDTPLNIVSFGVDEQGELVVVDYGGALYRLLPNDDQAASAAFPQRLSETGLFASTADHTPAPGVLRYEIHAELYAEGAVSERLLAVPDNGAVCLPYYAYPRDTVAVKTLSLRTGSEANAPLRRVETQLLHFDGSQWRGYSYLWNADQTDAELVPRDGLEIPWPIAEAASAHSPSPQAATTGKTWRIASRSECLNCHVWPLGFVAGFKLPNLNLDVAADPHLPGSRAENQLERFERLGLFDIPLTDTDRATAMVNPHDSQADLELRARSYLAMNCSHCHRREGGGTARIEFPFEFSPVEMQAIDVAAAHGNFSIENARIIAPGEPERSVLYYRLATVGRGHMPRTGSQEVDEEGLRLIRDWIVSLGGEAETSTRNVEPLLLENWSSPEFRTMVQGILTDTSSSLHFADRISRMDSEEHRRRVAGLVAQQSPVHLKGIFERLLPPHERRQTLGTDVVPEEILSLAGRVDEGRVLFEVGVGISCRNCHIAGTVGQNVGPDLSEIGTRRTAAQILQSILEPSRDVDPRYYVHVLETVSGHIYTGILIDRDDDRLLLRDSGGKDIIVSAEEIESLTPQVRSMMPDGLVQEMTAQELADLVAYLQSLK